MKIPVDFAIQCLNNHHLIEVINSSSIFLSQLRSSPSSLLLSSSLKFAILLLNRLDNFLTDWNKPNKQEEFEEIKEDDIENILNLTILLLKNNELKKKYNSHDQLILLLDSSNLQIVKLAYDILSQIIGNIKEDDIKKIIYSKSGTYWDFNNVRAENNLTILETLLKISWIHCKNYFFSRSNKM